LFSLLLSYEKAQKKTPVPGDTFPEAEVLCGWISLPLGKIGSLLLELLDAVQQNRIIGLDSGHQRFDLVSKILSGL
jgi:hypothetical protein